MEQFFLLFLERTAVLSEIDKGLDVLFRDHRGAGHALRSRPGDKVCSGRKRPGQRRQKLHYQLQRRGDDERKAVRIPAGDPLGDKFGNGNDGKSYDKHGDRHCQRLLRDQVRGNDHAKNCSENDEKILGKQKRGVKTVTLLHQQNDRPCPFISRF